VYSVEVEQTVVENMFDLYLHYSRGLAAVACMFVVFRSELLPFFHPSSFLPGLRYCLLSHYEIRYYYFFLLKPSVCWQVVYHASQSQTGILSANLPGPKHFRESPLHFYLRPSRYHCPASIQYSG
jgi:hypothetical protein